MPKVTLEEIEQLKDTDAPLHDRIRAMFHGTIAMRDFVKDSVFPLVGVMMDRNEQEHAILGIFHRMFFWLDSMAELNKAQHFQAASSGARSMLELLFDIKQLVKDPANAERFNAFTFVERFRAAKRQVEFSDQNGGDPADLAHERAFVTEPANISNYDALRLKHWGTDRKGKTIKPTHWSKLNVAAQAKSLGLEYERLYTDVYSRLSWYVHGGASGISGISGPGLQAAFGWAHALCQTFVFDATEELATAFHLFKASPDLREKLETAKRIPGESLIKMILAARDKASE